MRLFSKCDYYAWVVDQPLAIYKDRLAADTELSVIAAEQLFVLLKLRHH